MKIENITLRTLAFIILSLIVTVCSQKKEKTLADNLLDTAGYTLMNTTSKCAISSSDNSNYFLSGTTISGTSSIVDRIIKDLPSAGPVEIYYPRGTSTGLPVVVLFQGGNVHSSFYSRYAARIAADGYVVYVPNRCTIFFTQFFLKVSSAAGNEVLTLAKSQNSDSTSELRGRLDTEKMGYLGHSLGGVTALFVLNDICQFPFCDPGTSFLSQVKVAVVYGAGLTNQLDPNKIKLDSAGKATPVAILQGSVDSAFPPKDGQLSYDNYKSTKYLVSVEGANHYSITDVSAPFGSAAEKTNSTISQDAGISRISQVSILFLNGYLKANQADLTKVQTNATGITGITVTASP